MDRLLDTDVDTSGEFAFWRQYNVEGATIRGEDDDLRGIMAADGTDLGTLALGDPLPAGAIFVDRRDREHVAYYLDTDGKWKPSRLKRDDDVIIGGMQARVLGPAAGREWVFVYNESWFGTLRLPMSFHDITERAPADANETPDMPLYDLTPPPEPEQQQPEEQTP